MELIDCSQAPHEQLYAQVCQILTHTDPVHALQQATVALGPLMVYGLLSQDQVADTLEDAAHDRGLDGEEVATILFTGLTAPFN
ncbi:hypothetical protein [Nocardiopsis dassonvillei]|uniref:hypothetical protein n=1 Tax=Nocardiopsis dassonvillei TaxID=2014 RepID=UPI00363F450F